MPESLQLAEAAPAFPALESERGRLAPEPALAIVKVQVRIDRPDDWLASTLGVAAPSAGQEVAVGAVDCAWLAPGEWLLTGPNEEVTAIGAACRKAAGNLGLVIDLSHGRVAFSLSGPEARSALASYCPLDLREEAMPVGAARRSVFAETGFFLARKSDRDGQPSFRLIFDQTMADYAHRLLRLSLSGEGK